MWDQAKDPAPPPEAWLTAYLDGELCDEARERVEAWLAQCPEAVRRLEEEERLLRLVRHAAAPEPEPRGWSRTFSGISGRVSAAHAAPPSTWRRAALISGVAAVLCVGTLGLWWSKQQHTPPEPQPIAQQPAEDLTPFAVAGANDVTIVSMDDADARALVGVRPPVDGPLILASTGDIQVERMEPHSDGAVPDFRQPPRGTPMVVGPLIPAWGGD